MDIGSTLKAIIRFWWITVPVILLTIAGVYYVAFLQPRLYESQSTYLMLNPEPGRAATANPFLQLPDQAAIVGVLSEIVNSPRVNTELVAQGASADYEVGPSETYGQGSRILDVYAPGTSPAQALLTTQLVGDRLKTELNRIQEDQQVRDAGKITLLALNPEPEARLKVSSLLRSVVAVVLLGGVVLFLVIGVSQAIADARVRRRQRKAARASVLQQQVESAADARRDSAADDIRPLPEGDSAVHEHGRAESAPEDPLLDSASPVGDR